MTAPELSSIPGKPNRQRPLLLVFVLFALGAVFIFGGIQLALTGGSKYYLLAGAGLLGVSGLTWFCKRAAVWGYALISGLTILWAIYESGFDVWALMPRIFAPTLLGLSFALPGVRKRLGANRLLTAVNPALFVVAMLVLAGSYHAHSFTPVAQGTSAQPANEQSGRFGSAWAHYGGNAGGQRFAGTSQINVSNVADLELAWSYRVSGTHSNDGAALSTTLAESTPIEVDGRLFLCTSTNIAISLDGDSGEEFWRFDPQVQLDPMTHTVCRGMAYYQNKIVGGNCSARLFMGTVDNRLVALDADTGQLCPDFAANGFVNLNDGLGEVLPGYSYVTSPPTVLNGVVVVGSFVLDNQSTDEPPGVVRAYDAVTGELVWAWDVLSPKAHPPRDPDDSYPRNTPNVWSVASTDPELGLIYLPTGNTPPDFFGGNRSPEQDRYSSSIVALDIQTGNVKWSFQTVTHDIWDFDIASQPVVIDWATANEKHPALIVTTKRGEIFVLDRRNGKPLTRVEEKPVPQNPAAGEWLAKTQPFSVGFPSFAPGRLTEASMWGVTPIDQLWCRVEFMRSRYEGQFTPHSTQGMIAFPGVFGVFNWGSVSVDPERGLIVVNTSYFPSYQKLIERREADGLGIAPWGTSSGEAASAHGGSEIYYAQAGTPYAIDSRPFLSPLGFPCHEPPWGELSVVDLNSREIVWQRPLGTTRDVAPLGLPLPTGVFNIGGSVTTQGGLIFIGATIDDYLRAFDIDTGRELWKARLPAGGQSSPMSYVSKRSGRQYVLIAAGGHVPMETTPGDYVLAYALPGKDH